MMNVRFLLVFTSVLVIVACGGGGGGATYHIAISHSGTGLTCESSTITLTLHEDGNHKVTEVDENETVTITLQPSVGGNSSFNVTVPKGKSSVTFDITQTTAASVDIDAAGDNASAPDDHGSEDPAIVFSDTGFRFYVNSSHTDSTPISTQIGGKTNSQTLTLKAIETNSDTGACQAALTSATDVEIAYECENPTTCSSNQLSFTANSTVQVTGSANQASFNFSSPSSNFTTVPMNFNGSGEASFSFLFNDVGQIKLHAKSTLPSSGPTLTGSSNAFVVRPFGLYVYAVDDTLAVNGTDAAFKKVGENFSIGVKGVLYNSSDDDNADGIPNGYPGSDPSTYADLSNNTVAPSFGSESVGEDVTLAVAHLLPSAGTVGTLAGDTEVTSFSSGAGLNNSGAGSATYSKVGLIDISGSIKDGSYLGVNAASGTHAIYGSSGHVGRFTPDHYELSVSAGIFDSACNNFTYIGQAFSYAAGSQPAITVTAKDSAGNTLQNYLGLSGGSEGFKKLTNTSMQPMHSTTPVTITSNNIGADSTTAMPVSAIYQSPGVADAGSAHLTVFTLSATDSFTYTRNANAEVSNYVVDLPLLVTQLTDSDGITAVHAVGALDNDGNSIAGLPVDSTNPFVVTMTAPGENQYFGRFRLENTFGPETAPLALPVNIEYLTSTGFVINGSDGCTAIVADANFDLNVIDDDAVDDDGDSATDNPGPGVIIGIVIDASSTTGTIANDPFDAGEAGFSFSAPGADATAAIEVQLLDSANDYPWLLYNWDGVDQLSDGDMLDDLPSSTATFGRFRGHDNIIYWQEVTN